MKNYFGRLTYAFGTCKSFYTLRHVKCSTLLFGPLTLFMSIGSTSLSFRSVKETLKKKGPS